ncbi:hypothetical protein VKS41_007179 [Umbelopsis sp. WA50703]
MVQSNMKETRQGVVMLGKSKLEVRTFPIPTPGHGQVRLKVKASTLCGSDLNLIYRKENWPEGPGKYCSVVAGHEPCGIIDQVGEGTDGFVPGDRCIVYHISGCGVCHDCRMGWHISCTGKSRKAYGYQRDGGHSDYIIADIQNLVKMPDFLSYIDGAMVACGVGTAFAACIRAQVSGRDRVLVTGLGPVGMCVALLARASGAEVFGVELIPERRKLAADLGFNLVESNRAAVDAVTDSKGFEVCFDASGNRHARHFCLEAARQWGRVVYVGEGSTVEFSPSPLLLHKQITLHGSWVCNMAQMEDLVELLARWKLHPDVLVTHRYKIEEAEKAYELFDAGKTGKVAFVWDDEE